MRRNDSRLRTLDKQDAISVERETKRVLKERPTDVDINRTPLVVVRLERMVELIVWVLALLSFLYIVFLMIFIWFNPSLHQLQMAMNFKNPDTLTPLSASKEAQELSMLIRKHQELRAVQDGERIPRIIHQTYKSEKLPSGMVSLVKSWIDMNPNWTYRFYNDTDCLEFVKNEFPQYLDAYKSLPKNVERSDFFRYMVILRFGGVYADLDTECRQSFDEFIEDSDSLIVGWEGDVPNEAARRHRHFSRYRQILQWVFAAIPDHPVLKEVCDFISENSKTVFSNNSNFNTLEKTGPGIWTDLVMKYAREDNSIRIMPTSAFGVHPSGPDGIYADSRGLIILHHFLGSWKNKEWGKRCLLSHFICIPSYKRDHQVPAFNASTLYPVSASFHPPFTIMVYPRSCGPYVGDSDVSSELTLRGVWQSSNANPGPPRVVDVIAGSLGFVNMDLTFLDIGAGLGFFSLAVASRNHPVIAFELPGLGAHAFQESIHRNNFTKYIHYYSSIFGLLNQLNYSLNTTIKFNKDEAKEIGTVRIGYTGWHIWKTLNGTELIQRVDPEIAVIEFSPYKMKQSNIKIPLEFLHELFSLGYEEVYHSGELCDRRWKILSKQIEETDHDHHQQQPNWCTVMPEDFNIFLQINDQERTPPENVLFVKKKKLLNSPDVID
eukprot:g1068.t1